MISLVRAARTKYAAKRWLDKREIVMATTGNEVLTRLQNAQIAFRKIAQGDVFMTSAAAQDWNRDHGRWLMDELIPLAKENEAYAQGLTGLLLIEELPDHARKIIERVQADVKEVRVQ